MHQQPKPLPLSKRIIRDTSLHTPSVSADEFRLARGAYRAWENVSMQNALKAVDKGEPVRRAAELYNVPRSTLFDRVTGKVVHGARSGPQPYLSIEEEEELTNFLLETAKIGYAHTRKQVLALVQQMVNSKGIATTVTNGWWERYVQRHPNITLRVAVPFSYARAMATDREVIDRYFDMLEDCLRSNGLLNKAAVIFNCDETGLPLDPKSHKVVDRVGCKNPSYITSGSKSQITVLACTCAAGYPIPPMVIFDRMTLNDSMTKGEVPGSIYGLSRNGWITRKIFCEWFQHFLNSIPSVRPVLLLLDGHSAHYCPETIRMAAKEKVILCALPPHTTHLTQPLDIGCFAPLKVAWREICHSFCASNPGRTVSRYDFCEVFAKAWYKSFTMPNIINSFKATGVCPLNRMAISLPDDEDDFSSFKPSSLTEKTGLAYIPLYSPARPRATHLHGSGTQEMATPPMSRACTPCQFTAGSNDRSLCYMTPLSYSEPNLFDQSFISSKAPAVSVPLPCSSTISKFLVLPPRPNQIPTKHGKSAGRVLTSLENLQLIQEREKQKQEKALQKEERKRLRDEKAKKKIEDTQKKKEAAKCKVTIILLLNVCL